ncbi:MAG: 3-coathanger stack domain-containing protein [Bacteroidota bacterium]
MQRITLAILCLMMAFSITQAQITNDDCEQAIEVFCGDEVEVDFGEERSDHTWITGCGYDSSNESVWYKFKGTGKTISIEICGGSNYLNVFDGTCDQMTCTEQFTYGVVYPESCSDYARQVTFSSQEGEEYYILCSTYQPSFRANLKIQCLDPLVNDACGTAKSIEMDSTVIYNHNAATNSQFIACDRTSSYGYKDSWYTFEGTGELIKIVGSENGRREELYEGDCIQFKCIEKEYINGATAYQTKRGKTYYLQISSNQSLTFSFTIKKVNFVGNNECSGALPVVVGDTITANFLDTRRSTIPCFNSLNSFSVWYVFEGNDSVLNVLPIDNDNNLFYRMATGSCEEFVCERLTFFPPNSTYSIFTQKGKKYYLNISERYNAALDQHKFYTYSSAPVSNNLYTDALPISCQDTVKGTLVGAQSDYSINSRDEPSVWYTLTGTGEFYKVNAGFENRSSYYRPWVYFYKEEDGNLVSASSVVNNYIYLEEDVVYYVDVISDDVEDPFWVKLNCAPKVPRDLCDDAETITPQGLTIYSRGLSYGRKDSRATCSSSNYADTWFRVEGNNKYYNIELTDNSYYGFRYSLYEGNCDSLVCLAARVSSYTHTRAYLEEGKQYYVQVYSSRSTWPEISGFELSFLELPIAPNDLCAGATTLEDGSEITDSLDHAAINDPTCGEDSSLPGLWYQLEGDGKYYTLDILLERMYYSSYSASRHNITLFEGNCDEFTCIDNQSLLSNSKLTFFAEEGKSYFLNYHNSVQYHINMKVSSSELVDNDDIIDAIPIACETAYSGQIHTATFSNMREPCVDENIEDIWFETVGNGEYVHFSNNNVEGIYTLSDDLVQCHGTMSEEGVFLEENQVYYIRYLIGNDGNYIKTYDFTMNCYPTITNSACLTASEIECGKDYVINTLYADAASEQAPCTSSNSGDAGVVWYKIVGDNSWKKIDGENLVYQIYEGHCGELSCINAKTFFVEEGKDYYIRMYTNSRSNNVIKFSIECSETLENDFCTNAATINCGDTVRAKLDFATDCENSEDCDYTRASRSGNKRLWYSIVGKGEFVNLELVADNSYSFINNYGFIEVYERGCCDKKRIENLYDRVRNLSFYAREDSTYLIAVRYSRSDSYDKDFDLIATCESSDTSSIQRCEDALSLTPRQSYSVDLSKATSYYNYLYNTNNAEFTWLSFEGSGGTDTLEVDHSSNYISSLGVYYYVDIDEDCNLIPLYNSHLASRDYSNDLYSFEFATEKGVKYVVGLHSGYGRDKIVDVILKSATSDNKPCKLTLPESTTLSYGYNTRIPLNVTDVTGTLELEVIDHSDKSRTKYRDFENGQYFNISPKFSGTSIVEYEGEGCYGHGLLNVEVTDLPKDPCSDEVLLCEELIEHFDDDELTDSTYQALIIESSAIVSLEANVDYFAEKEVLLLPGFETEDDSDFTAEIVECEVAENSEEEVVEERSFEETAFKKEVNLTTAPNPFTHFTNIQYQLPERSEAQLLLFTAQGQLARSILPAQTLEAGKYNASLNGSYLEAGLYFLILQTTTEKVIRKLVVVK